MSMTVERFDVEIPQHPEMELFKERDRLRKQFAFSSLLGISACVISAIATKQFGTMSWVSLGASTATAGAAYYHHNERKKELKGYADGAELQYSYRTAMARIFSKFAVTKT